MTDARDSHHAPRSGAEVESIHHVELYVSNSHQAAHFYRTALGFEIVGRLDSAGPSADRTSVAIRQGAIRLLLTAPLNASSGVAEHLRVHGEGIKDIAFSVSDVDAAFARAVDAGARLVRAPANEAIGSGRVRTARIASCGVLEHTLTIDDTAEPWSPWAGAGAQDAIAGLESIDHIALAVSAGELDAWVAFYLSAFGFKESHQEDVSTEYTAMRSKVVQSPNAAVRFPMMAPAPGRRKSQIDTYIESHGAPGAQHLALRARDIVQSVAAMSSSIDFLPTPSAYYDSLASRVGDVAAEISALQRYGILADRDASGLLLQVFTRPIGPRPTLFLELIERRGADGFGSGNIKALFEAVERTQMTPVASAAAAAAIPGGADHGVRS
jgi:4-hydroxyphenylpyruvate dioxygenase